MMTGSKKGPDKEEKAKNVEKMTDEQLDGVSGGKIGCKPWICLPFAVVGSADDQANSPNQCAPHRRR